MSFPVPVVLPFNFQSELGTSFGTHLDANFVELADTINEVLANLQLIQRDDGAIRNQTVHANAFTSDALVLMAGSSVSSSVAPPTTRDMWSKPAPKCSLIVC